MHQHYKQFMWQIKQRFYDKEYVKRVLTWGDHSELDVLKEIMTVIN